MRYLVEFRLPSDSGIESSLKEREGFLEGSMEDQEDVEDRGTPQEGEVTNRYSVKDAFRAVFCLRCSGADTSFILTSL